ncbi:MAG: histidine--tRNA ligase [Pseudomonadota bacterium]
MAEEKTALQAVKGMNDILPPESAAWEWFEGGVRGLMERHGYANVRTPIVEPTALFARALGEVTDIVEKEMYSFEDAMNQDRLTLRPENTAGVVRAMNEHSFLRDGGKRLFYMGAMFRHERPQKGRYRQFHQVGAEALGFAGPDVDAELILMCRALWRQLGLEEGKDLWLELNSLGQPDERLAHRQALVAHLEAHSSALDADALRRLHTNPLRILDTKNPAMQSVVESAPQLMDFLGEASLAHFNGVRAVLDAAGLPYRINPRLVRGMDYYNLTVFEWVTDRLGSQGTVCGGGRYDSLIEQLGGRSAPAVGWGMGIERLLLLLKAIDKLPEPRPPMVYAVVPSVAALPAAMTTLDALRAAGVSVVMNAMGAAGPVRIRTQFERANHSGARHALIFGDDEIARGEVGLKDLRDAGAPQRSLPLNGVNEWAVGLINA